MQSSGGTLSEILAKNSHFTGDSAQSHRHHAEDPPVDLNLVLRVSC